MRVLGFLLRFITPAFMTSYWTTLGSTVYAPTSYDEDADFGTPSWLAKHSSLQHELVHVEQFRDFGWVRMALLYLGPAPFLLPGAILAICLAPAGLTVLIAVGIVLALAPLSVGLAWGRWRLEREAYLITLSTYEAGDYERVTEWIVDTLVHNYAFTWPRSWMRTWFQQETAKWS
jgi:hypothetical protein